MAITTLLARIDQNTQAFKTLTAGMSQEQLNWKPTPGVWSVAQNIDHLIAINKSYYPIVDALKKGTYRTPFTAKIGFWVNWMGKMILGSVQPDRKRKMNTFPVWEPAQSSISGNIMAEYEQHQETLKQLMLASGDLLERGAVISSPANRNVVYTLATAFEIIVTHEERHLAQAREIAALLRQHDH